MNPKHHIFLSEVVRHGDANKAYKAAYPETSGESLRVAANRLLHSPEMATYINNFHENVRRYIAKDMAGSKMQQVEDIRRKRQVLKSIYTKTMENTKTVFTSLGIRDINVEPTNAEILKAIHLDNALAEKEMKLLDYEPIFVLDEATADGSAEAPAQAGEDRPEAANNEIPESVTERNNTPVAAAEAVCAEAIVVENVTNRNNFKPSAHEHEYENKNQANNLPHHDTSEDLPPVREFSSVEMTNAFCSENVTNRNIPGSGIKQTRLLNRLKRRQASVAMA